MTTVNTDTAAGVGQGSVTRLWRAGERFRVSPTGYLDEAERLLERSRNEDVPAERITWAYRAALRAAGAAIEDARTARRRRSGGSAWSRLREANPGLADWSDSFEVLARFVSRVEMGSETGLRDADADHFYGVVCSFVDEVRSRVRHLPEVA